MVKERLLLAVFSSTFILLPATALQAGGQTTAVNQWTWLGGSQQPPPQTPGPYAIYGTKGVAAAGNTPGGRTDYQSWRDEQGNFWLFAGTGEPDDLWKLDAKSGFWTWVAGPNVATCDFNPCATWPAYGTVGVPDPTTNPGNREFPTAITASDGTFWLFGGSGLDNSQSNTYLNDLWRFDPRIGAWTWMSGSKTTLCDSGVPPHCGLSPVLGTLGVPAPANTPGATAYAGGWATPDKIWLYGGETDYDQGVDVKFSSILWSYDIASGMWTWVRGNADGYAGLNLPSYGTKGVAAPSNDPGGRASAATWTDNAGHLWLFSGSQQPNDMWEYDPATNEWTWVSGSTDPECDANRCPGSGVYGAKGVPAPDNAPGTRTGSMTWTAFDGTLWMYGGNGADSAGAPTYNEGIQTYLNDLWQFDPSTRLWTWIDGPSVQPCRQLPGQTTFYSSACWTPATFGTMGTPDPANTPGSRQTLGGWRDLAGNLRLLGGDRFFGIEIGGELVYSASMDDSWVYQPPSAFAAVTPAPSFSVPDGAYSSTQSVSISDASSGAAIYYTTDGSTPSQSSELYTGPIQIAQNTVLKAIAVANAAAPSAVTEATYVLKWSFSLAMAAGSTSTVNIPVGLSGTYTLAVNPVLSSKFPANVSFSISGLPQGATATFSPSSITAGSSRTTINLSVQTTAATAMRVSPAAASLFLCVTGLPILLLRTRRLSRCLTLPRTFAWGLLLVLALGAVSACGGGGTTGGGGGGGGGTPGTPSGNYPLVVKATCGQSQATLTVTAQVQ